MSEVDSSSDPSPAQAPPQIRFSCYKCRANLRAPLRYVGRLAACPECGSANEVPHPGAAETHDVDELTVPSRAGREKYLDVLEAKASAGRVQQPPATPDDPTSRIWTWLLIVGNVLVVIAVLALVLWIWQPWAGEETVDEIDAVGPEPATATE
jgi:hypothetical protein